MSFEFPNPYRDVSAEVASAVDLGNCAACPLIAGRTSTVQMMLDHETQQAEAALGTQTADEAILQQRAQELLQAILPDVTLPTPLTAEQRRQRAIERIDIRDSAVRTHIQEVGAMVARCAGVTGQQGCGLE